MDKAHYKRLLKPFKQGYVASQIGVTQGWLSRALNEDRKDPLTKKMKRRIDFFLKNHKVKQVVNDEN
jgi:hypothetical protein